MLSAALVCSVSAGAGSVSELLPGYITHSELVLSICLRSCIVPRSCEINANEERDQNKGRAKRKQGESCGEQRMRP